MESMRTVMRSPLSGSFGRRHVVLVPGRCEGCRKVVELMAYDAREWVRVGPLPIFPLRAYRVFDECPNCRRARRMPREEYDAWVAEEVAEALQELDREPDHLTKRLKLAWRMYGLGRFEQALALLSPALLKPSPPPAVHHAVGVVLAGAEQREAAAGHLTKAVEQQPQRPDYRLDLARCLMRSRSSLALAEHHLADAHGLDKEDLTIALTLAQVRCWRGEWPKAWTTWQQCLRLDPDGSWQERHAALIEQARARANGTR